MAVGERQIGVELRGLRLVIDTNVVVAGLLTRAEEAPTRLLVDAMLGGRCRFLLSTELLAEYRLVLLRPKIAALHGLPEAEVDEILIRVAANGIVLEPPAASGDAARDRAGDGHAIALLDAGRGSLLVTGDLALFRRVGPRARRPRELFAPR